MAFVFPNVLNVQILDRVSDRCIGEGKISYFILRGSSVVALCDSVFLSVCMLVTFVSPAKTTEPIEMPFGA